MTEAPAGFKIPEFKEVEELLQQGGNNVTTFLEHTRDVYLAKLAAERDAERDAIRTQALTEGRREGITEGRREGITEGRREGITEGRREGITEGRAIGRGEGMANQREMLRRQAAKRFNAETVERVTEFVRTIEDPNHLTKVAELIVECNTDDELLNHLH